MPFDGCGRCTFQSLLSAYGTRGTLSPYPPWDFLRHRRERRLGDTRRGSGYLNSRSPPTPMRRSLPVIPGRVASPQSPLAFGRKALLLRLQQQVLLKVFPVSVSRCP